MEFIKVFNITICNDCFYFPGLVFLQFSSFVWGISREAMWDLSLFERCTKLTILDSKNSSSTLKTCQSTCPWDKTCLGIMYHFSIIFAFSSLHVKHDFFFCKQPFIMWSEKLGNILWHPLYIGSKKKLYKWTYL